ncbi:MarR family winged helix-turn-helix transcriptional regulator [Nonomuraea sp. NPDC050556]|uniref:MarR family winged helix-turn-helix transcriptional regulator n=1 Tax=Nonomuraea sp. NPDC050556 TaxID=3364369 RepID=UPI0037A719B2
MTSVSGSLAFQLGKLGQAATAGFADRLAPLGLRPRHCGVLELLAGGGRGQLDLARTLDVTPSVVVDMLDELEALHAVRRTRDTGDRRRQIVELTPEGRELRLEAARLAHEVDAELLGHLGAEQLATLRLLLGQAYAPWRR